MYIALLIALSLFNWTEQHLSFPISYCNMAMTCIHDNRVICASSGCSKMTFLDQCDMYEYNCDYHTMYEETDSSNCKNPDTIKTSEENKIVDDNGDPTPHNCVSTIKHICSCLPVTVATIPIINSLSTTTRNTNTPNTISKNTITSSTSPPKTTTSSTTETTTSNTLALAWLRLSTTSAAPANQTVASADTATNPKTFVVKPPEDFTGCCDRPKTWKTTTKSVKSVIIPFIEDSEYDENVNAVETEVITEPMKTTEATTKSPPTTTTTTTTTTTVPTATTEISSPTTTMTESAPLHSTEIITTPSTILQTSTVSTESAVKLNNIAITTQLNDTEPTKTANCERSECDRPWTWETTTKKEITYELPLVEITTENILTYEYPTNGLTESKSSSITKIDTMSNHETLFSKKYCKSSECYRPWTWETSKKKETTPQLPLVKLTTENILMYEYPTNGLISKSSSIPKIDTTSTHKTLISTTVQYNKDIKTSKTLQTSSNDATMPATETDLNDDSDYLSQDISPPKTGYSDYLADSIANIPKDKVPSEAQFKEPLLIALTTPWWYPTLCRSESCGRPTTWETTKRHGRRRF